MDNRLKKQFLSLMGRMDNRMTLNEAQEFTSKIILNEQKKGYQKIVGSFMEVLGKSGKNIGNYLDDVQIKYNSFLDDVLKKFDDASMLYKSTDDLITSLKSLPSSTKIKRYFNELEKSMIDSLENIARSNGELDILEQAKKVMSGAAIPKDIPTESLRPYLESLKNIENIKIHNKVLSIIGDMGESIKRGDTDILSIFTNSLLKNNSDLSVKNIMSDIDNLKVFSKESDDFLNDIFERIDDLGVGLKNEDDILKTLGISFDNTYKFKEGFFKRMLNPESAMSANFDSVIKKVSSLDLDNTIIVKQTKSDGVDVITFVEVKNATPEKINIIKNQLNRNFIDVTDKYNLKGNGGEVKDGIIQANIRKIKITGIIIGVIIVDLFGVNYLWTKLSCSGEEGNLGDTDKDVDETLDNISSTRISREDNCFNKNYLSFSNTVTGSIIGVVFNAFSDTVEELGEEFKGYIDVLKVTIKTKIDRKLNCCYKLNLENSGKAGCTKSCEKGCDGGDCDGILKDLKTTDAFKNITDFLNTEGNWYDWIPGMESIPEKKKRLLEKWKNNGELPKEFFNDEGNFNISTFVTSMCEVSKKLSNSCRAQQIINDWNTFNDQGISEETCDSNEHKKIFLQQKEMAKYIENGLVVDWKEGSEDDLENVITIGNLMDKIEVPFKSENENTGEVENNAIEVVKKNIEYIVNRENYCKCIKNPTAEGCGGSKTENKGQDKVTLKTVKEYIDEVIVKEFNQDTCDSIYRYNDKNRYEYSYKTYLTNAGYSETDVKDGLEYIFNVKIPEYCNK